MRGRDRHKQTIRRVQILPRSGPTDTPKDRDVPPWGTFLSLKAMLAIAGNPLQIVSCFRDQSCCRSVSVIKCCWFEKKRGLPLFPARSCVSVVTGLVRP